MPLLYMLYIDYWWIAARLHGLQTLLCLICITRCVHSKKVYEILGVSKIPWDDLNLTYSEDVYATQLDKTHYTLCFIS
jgi:hypothetical protein